MLAGHIQILCIVSIIFIMARYGGVLLGGTSYLYNCTIVGNDKYGCWAWNNNQHFFNVVIFGNESEWNGNLPNKDSAEFVGCASSGSARIVTGGEFGVKVISDDAFANYATVGEYLFVRGRAFANTIILVLLSVLSAVPRTWKASSAYVWSAEAWATPSLIPLRRACTI